jgi:hypothetical protein
LAIHSDTISASHISSRAAALAIRTPATRLSSNSSGR